MLESMQDWPLLTWRIIDHAALNYPKREIVTQAVEGGLHRTNWARVHHRSRQLAQALHALGVDAGDRVATLAWNTWRHIECWYGISGMGAVTHTINPRLFVDQIVYIANHAADDVLFLDLTFLPLVERVAPLLTTVRHFVLLTDRAHMPTSSLDLKCYEDLLAEQDGAFAWAELDERSPAGLCYTSGTTGHPKGVLYTHRSNVLHTWHACQADMLGITARTTVLPIVPMFHANAWGIPYAAAMVGAKIVLGGPNHDAATLHRLIVDEQVTLAAGVPTVWLGLLQHAERLQVKLAPLERIVVGGSAAPRAMIDTLEREHGIAAVHLWGMTELSPIGTTSVLCAGALQEDADAQMDLKCKQGRAAFGVEMRVTNDANETLARDGKSLGHVKVRGPWVVRAYYRSAETATLDDEGWFDTGDIGSIDELGYMHITDRSKDVIKSGGEWISSIDLENAAIGCPGIAEAAVIGVPHPKWDERPLLVVVPRPDATPSRQEILAYLDGTIAKWWMPDDVVFVNEIPHTATGKILKTALRLQFRDYTWPVPAGRS